MLFLWFLMLARADSRCFFHAKISTWWTDILYKLNSKVEIIVRWTYQIMKIFLWKKKKKCYEVLMRCFMSAYEWFGGREVLSLNSSHEIRSSHCEATSDLRVGVSYLLDIGRIWQLKILPAFFLTKIKDKFLMKYFNRLIENAFGLMQILADESQWGRIESLIAVIKTFIRKVGQWDSF